jgi:SpoIID/LytB domain protein
MTFTRRIVALALAGLVVVGVSACEPANPGTVTIKGRGWGHGYGMGQYGALGYAVDHGWTYDRILGHYYGGTTMGTLADGRVERVHLQAQAGSSLIVTQDKGELVLSSDAPARHLKAVRISRTSGGFQVAEGQGCAGPWTVRPGVVGAAELQVAPAVGGTDDPANFVTLCGADGQRKYRGQLIAVQVGAEMRTVNRVRSEDLIRSVIAAEMSPSWGALGGGRGMEALKAQAVAARSFAAAGDTRWGAWATSCDTYYCQVYRGHSFRANGTSTFKLMEYASTDAATAATARQVRMFGSRVALTQFGTSSGGYTKPGTFPAVVDDGDATSSNQYDVWTVTKTAADVEAAFDRRQGRDVGTYQGSDVVARNGLGADGGRVTSIKVRFSKESVTLSGTQFQSLLGLRSDWFTIS